MINAPYRFVPLSNYILRPHWAKLVSHDHPFSDGLSGVIDITIKTITPLCVGGKQTSATADKPGIAHFYKDPNQQLAIPGTSIKGMLRNVIEVACFGYFNPVDEAQLGVRDISKADNFYCKEINRQKPKAGFLTFKNNAWCITPCSFTRIHQEKIIQYCGISKNEWNDSKNLTATARYQLLKNKNQGILSGNLISFDLTSKKDTDHIQQAENLGKGEQKGYLVVTGQPGAVFTKNNAKKRDFIFHAPQSESIQIDSKVMNGFMHIHKDSDEWAFWMDQLKSLPKEIGIPVFYHADGSKIKSFGLARMYRLPYKNTLHDAIRNQQPAHLDRSAPDLPGLIFGWMDENEKSGQHNIRGRVMPSLFTLQTKVQPHLEKPMVLGAPQPTFYPAYLVQEEGKGYKTLMEDKAQLSGWKRYPLKDLDIPDLDPLVEKNKKVQIQLEALPKDCLFKGKIRFHNLRFIELGALLWSLNAGDQEYHHSLGLGKPYGFGEIKLSYEINPTLLRANQERFNQVPADKLIEMAKIAFRDYMNHAFAKSTGKEQANWEQSPQVKALRKTMTYDEFGNSDVLSYMKLAEFSAAKKAGESLAVLEDQPDMLEPKKLDLNAPLPDEDEDTLMQKVEEAAQQAQKAQAKEAEKQAREQAKSSMTENEKIVADLEDKLQKAREDSTKSALKNLVTEINSILKMDDVLNEQKQSLIDIAQNCIEFADSIGKSKDELGKKSKRLLNDLNSL